MTQVPGSSGHPKPPLSPGPGSGTRTAATAVRPRMTSRAKRHPAVSDHTLLSAAEELFAERGYRHTTVALICSRAGIATGSFYAHFGSKAAIFAAVLRRISTDLRSAMRAAAEQADSWREMERAFFEMHSKRPGTDRIVRESEFVAPGVFREHYQLLVREYARSVRRAQLAGQVDTRYDPEVIAYMYAGIANFLGIRWADWTAGGNVPDDVLDDVLCVLACGLAPQGDAAARIVTKVVE